MSWLRLQDNVAQDEGMRSDDGDEEQFHRDRGIVFIKTKCDLLLAYVDMAFITSGTALIGRPLVCEVPYFWAVPPYGVALRKRFTPLQGSAAHLSTSADSPLIKRHLMCPIKSK